MNYEHQIFLSNRLAVVRLHGSVTAETIMRCAEDLYADPAWDPSFNSIWDVREIAELIIMPEDIARLVNLSAEMTGRAGSGRRAIVVARALEHGIATLFSYRAKPLGRETRVFWSIDEAREWLDVQLGVEVRKYLRIAA